MANTYITPQIITRESLRLLENNLAFTSKINRQYDSQFAKSGGKIGNTLQIRLPVQGTVRYGPIFSPLDIVETKVDLVVSNLIGVDFEIDDVDLALSIDDFNKRYLEPNVALLAQAIDSALLTQAFTDVTQDVGTAGNTPSDLATYLEAGQVLDEAKAPRGLDQRFVVVSPAAQALTVAELAVLFNNQGTIGKQYDTGEMSRALGFTWDMDQNVPEDAALAFHKDAFTMVTADLELPKGVDMADRASHAGISIRFIRDYNINNNTRGCRLDILYGFKTLRPELAVKVYGTP